MNILIVGSGGREHALLWKLHADAPDAQFFITHGNGGTGELAAAIPLDVNDARAIADWSAANDIDLVVIGPEAALADGLTDALALRGVPAFGPTRAAADIEASKAFAKSLMQRAHVPTAAHATFTSFDAAAAYIRQRGAPIVVKASGLAAGKGAVVCTTTDEAIDTAHTMLDGATFGAAGNEVVVEEFMAGEELSLFALCDGSRAIPMLGVQDHKRVGAGDTGPNTGGMGAYAPVSISTPALIEQVCDEILQPVLRTMKAEGRPFSGLLYAGLMLTESGPRVVEFNARFGDPETQVILPLMASSLLEPLHTIARGGSIDGLQLQWKPAAALTTVLAAHGYPGDVRKGDEIHLPAALEPGVTIFHAGTRRDGDRLITSGGRILAVTAVAPTLAEAAERSRRAAAAIEFNGCHYRPDIGWRELQRSETVLLRNAHA
jgi:phosphoribosylamine--glycine ligase